ncbi:hypothetical protein [Streptomyces similanensis]|uniref:Uncharacterized protein n=1 Tax=Streptomyces similanensis TaxID=1274988 RepID=A0ABP9L463_9ACTN
MLTHVIAARRRDVGLLDHLRSVKGPDATAAEVYRLAGWWAKDWEAVSQHYRED